jgi:ADP-heptose:LPS heptosyltransferase
MTWKSCRKILCVRPDNMGDLLMSAPALSALKEAFQCSVTLLTSSMARGIAPYIPGVDDVIEWNVPWVKGTPASTDADFQKIIKTIRERKFDGAIIFTVFSQNPLPTALMLSLAGIPLRLAYCRENPYHLLSHWIPDPEPYFVVRHQVRRDLDLVKAIGAHASNETITIRLPENFEPAVRDKLTSAGVDTTNPWLILHPGVSEKKREYPAELWIEAGKRVINQLKYQVVITGAKNEKHLADHISEGIGRGAYSLAGSLILEEFITLIRFSPLLISVNTASIHLAAALETKVIVLYALTNPQHTPWKAIGKILPYSVSEDLQSRNAVLQFVQRHYFAKKIEKVDPEDILNAAHELLIEGSEPPVEELVSSPPRTILLRNQQNFVFP